MFETKNRKISIAVLFVLVAALLVAYLVGQSLVEQTEYDVNPVHVSTDVAFNELKTLDSVVVTSAGNDIISEKALSIFEVAAFLSQDFALYLNLADRKLNLGSDFRTGTGCETLECLFSKIKAGDYQAVADLAWLYLRGVGVQQDTDKALVLLLLAAEKKISDAQTSLGELYYEGVGVEKDFDQAYALNLSAAEAGQVHAQTNVAWMSFAGEGVEKDESIAAKWYEEAAKEGYGYAQMSVSWMYRAGRGVEKNEPYANYWIHSAAMNGNVDAQFSLAGFYHMGIGFEQDKKAAEYWFRAAYQQGHKTAGQFIELYFE